MQQVADGSLNRVWVAPGEAAWSDYQPTHIFWGAGEKGEKTLTENKKWAKEGEREEKKTAVDNVGKKLSRH